MHNCNFNPSFWSIKLTFYDACLIFRAELQSYFISLYYEILVPVLSRFTSIFPLFLFLFFFNSRIIRTSHKLTFHQQLTPQCVLSMYYTSVFFLTTWKVKAKVWRQLWNNSEVELAATLTHHQKGLVQVGSSKQGVHTVNSVCLAQCALENRSILDSHKLTQLQLVSNIQIQTLDFPWMINDNQVEVTLLVYTDQLLCKVRLYFSCSLLSYLTQGSLQNSQFLLTAADTYRKQGWKVHHWQQNPSLSQGRFSCLSETIWDTLEDYHWVGCQYWCPEFGVTSSFFSLEQWIPNFRAKEKMHLMGMWHVTACSNTSFSICTPDLHTTTQLWLW